MTTLQLVRVHEPDAVREIVAEAWKIALEVTPNEGEFSETFAKAADLLAARIPVQPMPTPMIGGGFMRPLAS